MIEQKGLQKFTPLNVPIAGKTLDRIQLFLEIPLVGFNDETLKAASENALHFALCDAKIKMFNRSVTVKTVIPPFGQSSEGLPFKKSVILKQMRRARCRLLETSKSFQGFKTVA